MRGRLLFPTLISLLVFACLLGHAQSTIYWRVIQHDPDLEVFTKQDWSSYTIAAAIDKRTHKSYLFTCYGEILDSLPIDKGHDALLHEKKMTPFQFHNAIYDQDIALTEAAEAQLRKYGRLKPNWLYREIVEDYVPGFKQSTTIFEKIICLEYERANYLEKKWLLNNPNPRDFPEDTATLYLNQDAAEEGTIVEAHDSITWYSPANVYALYKGLLVKSKRELYFFDRDNREVDSIQINKAQSDSLANRKKDVFLLYRQWLEWQIKAQEKQIQQLVSYQGKQGAFAVQRSSRPAGSRQERLNAAKDTLIRTWQHMALCSYPDPKAIATVYHNYLKNRQVDQEFIGKIGGIAVVDVVETRGNKEYELTDQRGNVLSTVSDRKIAIPSATDSTVVDHYEADVKTAVDTYPFGVQMPGRVFNGGSYRFGLNGKEVDNDVKGTGNQINYDKRIYDPRLARFYSLDPLQTKFPFYSPYQFAGNTPIQAIDLDGAEEYHYSMTMDRQGRAVLNPLGAKYINHHSWFWGLYQFDTKILGKRYIIEYNHNTYYIGFAQVGTGYANAWKAAEFENNYIKKQGDYFAFGANYVDALHSQAGSDAATVMNAQNIGLETAIPQEEHISTPAQTPKELSSEVHGGNTASLPETSPKFDPRKPALTRGNLSVPASMNGHAPDFTGTPYLYPVNGNQKNIVQIRLTGSYSGDFSAANQAANLKQTPTGYTWHHLDDLNPTTGIATLQLVKSKVHRATIPHTGSIRQYEIHHNANYKQ